MSTKCPMCGSASSSKIEKYDSNKKDVTGTPIIIDAHENHCSNHDCQFVWIPYAEEKRIDALVASRSRHRLDSTSISQIRNALNFSTRAEAALFLNLNEKAFTKWEKNYSAINDAYDLLLRLAIYSKDNYNFIKTLHDKQFKFETEDYELLCEQSGKTWRYAQPILNTNLKTIDRKKYKTQEAYFNPPDNQILPRMNTFPTICADALVA